MGFGKKGRKGKKRANVKTSGKYIMDDTVARIKGRPYWQRNS